MCQLNKYICIGYILPTIGGYMTVGGCLCALRALGWETCVSRINIFVLDIFCQHLGDIWQLEGLCAPFGRWVGKVVLPLFEQSKTWRLLSSRCWLKVRISKYLTKYFSSIWQSISLSSWNCISYSDNIPVPNCPFFTAVPNCPGAKLSSFHCGAKLSSFHCGAKLSWCQIVLFYTLGAKLS